MSLVDHALEKPYQQRGEMHLLNKFNRMYTLVNELVACFLLVLSIVAATYGIISRVIPALPTIVWTEELSRFSIIAMVFLISGLVVRYEKDIGMDLFLDKLPIKARKITVTICNSVVTAYLAIVIWIIFNYLPIVSFQTSPAMNMPMSILYIIVGVGHILLVIENIISTIVKWKEIRS